MLGEKEKKRRSPRTAEQHLSSSTSRGTDAVQGEACEQRCIAAHAAATKGVRLAQEAAGGSACGARPHSERNWEITTSARTTFCPLQLLRRRQSWGPFLAPLPARLVASCLVSSLAPTPTLPPAPLLAVAVLVLVLVLVPLLARLPIVASCVALSRPHSLY